MLVTPPPSFLARRMPAVAALLAGALLPLAFAPVGFWPLSFVAPAVLLYLLHDTSLRRATWLGWLFGFGQFGVGVSWLYESFTLFGGAIAPLAALITAGFVAVMALYLALTAGLARWMAGPRMRSGTGVLAFAGSWVGLEWLRGWLFSGFPWLDIGIAQTTSPLKSLLPLVGEYGVGLVVVLLSGLLMCAALAARVRPLAIQRPMVLVLPLIVVWLIGWLLSPIRWTHPVGEPISVGVAQANIPQMQKFDPAFLASTLQRYEQLTVQMGAVDLVVWPETAVPDVLSDLPHFTAALSQRAAAMHQDFLIGAFTQDAAGHYYNTLVGIPDAVGSHRKAHLVPFSEYMPLRPLVMLLSAWIDVPMSDLTPGRADQPLPVVRGVPVGASICYEADFARDIRRTLPAAGFLVNVSNDSWFGDSFAPHQNLQMAAVRALEFGRPMIRATNTGISAFLSADGRIEQSLGVNRQGVLVGKVQPYQGSTPFERLGSAPTLILAAVLLFFARWRRRSLSGELPRV